MPSLLASSWRRHVAALALSALPFASAQAGLVTGNWDPAFGNFLPGLNWQVRAELLVPNACMAQADGIYNTGSCASANVTVQNVWLRLFDQGLADPNDFFTVVGGNPDPLTSPVHSTYFAFGGGFNVTNVRIESGQAVGFDINLVGIAQSAVSYLGNPFSFPVNARANEFRLDLTTNGPVLTCLKCDAVSGFVDNPDNPDVVASTENLSQFLVTYVDDAGQMPKFTDNQGNALGARLDAAGTYLGRSTSPNGNPVPEPPALALALLTLGALGATRRRRA
jgi:MYXO-CTERM domain-containing protein